MPELPDLTAYLEALEERLRGRRLERLRLWSPFLLRSVDPPPSELEGRELAAVERLGKRLVFTFEGDRFLVLHLMIAGRLSWTEATAREKRRGGKSGKGGGRGRLCELEFENGTVGLTEAASKKRAAIHLVRGRAALAAHDAGGIEPLSSGVVEFRAALARENRTLKRALTDPRLVAGIGNAYSDEILHAARLSPFARTGDLDDETWRRLHAATASTLTEWIERLRAERAGGFPVKVTAFRPEMAVHGRFGQPCPRCGGPVQRLVYAENEANYCPACQTGGKLLADRALSRLLKGDWPRTLEELEERKERARESGSPGSVGAALAALLLVFGASSDAAAFGLGAAAATVDRPRQDVELALPLPARSADPARLARALELFGEAAKRSALGPYALLTDVDDPALFARAAHLAATLDRTYAQRFGLRPVGEPRETVLLFAREEHYRKFQSGEQGLADITGASGLAGGGLVATYVGSRSGDEVLATLTHEWTHLLNRRALGPALPSWLDEGIAEDLGAAAIDGEGRLQPGSWSRLLSPRPSGWNIAGGEAALRELHALLPAGGATVLRPALATTLDLDWRSFSAVEAAPLHYSIASAFLRMLLGDERTRIAAQGWLQEVATGAPPEPEALRAALNLPWEELELRLDHFIDGQFRALPPLPKPDRIDRRD